MSEQQQLNTWAIIERIDHKMYAGKVTEQKFGCVSMLRLDVPEIGEEQLCAALAAQRKAEAEVVTLREALKEANTKFEQIHDEWAEPHASAEMGHIAVVCFAASSAIDAALSAAPRAAALAGVVEAARAVLIGGNHLASALINALGAGEDTFPPFTASFQEAAAVIADPNWREVWIAWRAVHGLRAALAALEGETTDAH